ncbi:acyltransferase [Flavobacterium sp. MK4S-17]|uniref:acyltransferase family protein n=1 Tax=Flavobacterium sp. MK4S-17 TaxID=2543737 RepID=UPI00135AD2A8|nr:acyltransferase [Flavobacterium sp. MK4S-17]
MGINTRINYIDNIKIAITFLVVAHHAGQAYGDTGGAWVVSDEPKLSFLPSFFFFNAAYMMGFFFFISGYFMYFSVSRKATNAFLKDRFRRLGLPLLFFTFIIFMPLHYIMSGSKEDYFEFMYNIYFHQPPLAVGHLWFVAALLCFTLLFLAVRQLIEKLKTTKFRWWFPLLYLCFLTIVNHLVWSSYPIDYWKTWIVPVEVAHLPQYLTLFFLGVVANQNKWLEDISLPVGLAYLFIGLLLFSFGREPAINIPSQWIFPMIESATCIGMILGGLVIFKRLLYSTNKYLKFFSDCSYGIYLFHLLIVILLQIMLKELAISTVSKFILVTIFAVILSAGLTFVLRKSKFLSKIL